MAASIFVIGVLAALVAGWFWHRADARYVKRDEFDEAQELLQKQFALHEETQKGRVSELRTEMTRAHTELRDQAIRQFNETRQSIHDLRDTINKGQLKLVEVVSEMRGELKGLIRDRNRDDEQT